MQQAIEALERLGGRVALQRVGAQTRAQLAHERRGPQPMAGDVADREADLAGGQLDDVVPVAADLVARRQVAHRCVDADEVGEAVGQQAALQGDRAAMLAVERVEQARAVDRGGGLRGGELQQRGVGVGELARRDRPDVQHAEGGALHEQRHAQQRAHALHAQDRVQDVGVVDVGDVDRPAPGRDPAREAARRPGCARRARPPPRAPWRRAPRAPGRPRRGAGWRRCRPRGCPSRGPAAR